MKILSKTTQFNEQHASIQEEIHKPTGNHFKMPKRIRNDSTSSSRSTCVDFDEKDIIENTELFNSVDVVKNDIKVKLPKIYHDNNVLVIGAHNVGKSSLINSIWLAMTGESQERSPPVGVTFHLGQHKLYGRDSMYSHDRGVRLPGGDVKLWDTRGFHLIHEERKAALILQYLLEGRLDRGFFHQALMLNEDKLKQRFASAEVSPRKHYKAVIFVERKNASEEMTMQTERLAKILQLALAKSKFNKIRNIPVIRALNGAEEEVKNVGKLNRLVSNVSSTESLHEVGLASKCHNLESYQWRVEYGDIDDEGFGNGGESEGELEDMPSTRFEFNNRYGPGKINPEQHLSLLLFLNELLQCLIDPNCEEAKTWRLEKDVEVQLEKRMVEDGATHSCQPLSLLKFFFSKANQKKEKSTNEKESSRPLAGAHFPKN